MQDSDEDAKVTGCNRPRSFCRMTSERPRPGGRKILIICGRGGHVQGVSMPASDVTMAL